MSEPAAGGMIGWREIERSLNYARTLPGNYVSPRTAHSCLLYLPRQENDKSQRVVQEGHGLMVDLTEDDRPIGIEIISPERVSLATMNEVLAKYALPPLDRQEMAPLAVVA